MDTSLKITGTFVNFYFHCKRQLWLFAHHINTEHDSDLVYLGRVIHETSYNREKKEIEIDQLKLDFLDVRNGVLHEVKKSDSWSKAHEWQVLYYLYALKQKGISNIRGELNYPVTKRTVSVELTREKENQLIRVLDHIQNILKSPTPPDIKVSKKLCRKCSYFELCYV